MIEVQLSKKNSSKTIVTLYGNIIEYFSALNYDGGRSIHVGHLTSIGIATNKKGKHELSITDERNRAFLHNPVNEVDDEALDKVIELVAAIQRARQSITL
ncbi:MAG: hypothetical protein KJ069_25450 [Anaerolineae bacterium]|nr:hypothetical protein [Anaerolineae bacterium]